MEGAGVMQASQSHNLKPGEAPLLHFAERWKEAIPWFGPFVPFVWECFLFSSPPFNAFNQLNPYNWLAI